MSDTIGVIGQKYEDRKSKKVGTLLERDSENKKLYLIDDENQTFSISFAAFKSNWRKVVAVEAEPVEEVADEPNVEAEPEQVEMDIPAFDNDDEKIKDFVKALTDARVACVEVTPISANVMADDITICTLDKVEGGYKMFMLPDIFIFTEWGNTFKAGDVHFNITHGRHTGVSVDCVKASLGDILQLIKTAAVEINLYGYID